MPLPSLVTRGYVPTSSRKQVVKLDATVAALQWSTNRQKGIETLRRTSSDENALRKIFGSKSYMTMMGYLNIPRVNAIPADLACESTRALAIAAAESEDEHSLSQKRRRLA